MVYIFHRLCLSSIYYLLDHYCLFHRYAVWKGPIYLLLELYNPMPYSLPQYWQKGSGPLSYSPEAPFHIPLSFHHFYTGNRIQDPLAQAHLKDPVSLPRTLKGFPH